MTVSSEVTALRASLACQAPRHGGTTQGGSFGIPMSCGVGHRHGSDLGVPRPQGSWLRETGNKERHSWWDSPVIVQGTPALSYPSRASWRDLEVNTHTEACLKGPWHLLESSAFTPWTIRNRHWLSTESMAWGGEPGQCLLASNTQGLRRCGHHSWNSLSKAERLIHTQVWRNGRQDPSSPLAVHLRGGALWGGRKGTPPA